MRPPFEVLLIDDNQESAQFILNLMSIESALPVFHLTHLEHLAEITSFLKNNTPQLIVFSFNKQGICEVNSLQALRQEAPATPIVVLVQAGNKAAAIEAKQYGVQDYLVKDGLTYDVLSIVCTNSIERHSLQEALKQSEQLLLQSTIDALQPSVAILDCTGNILAVNRSWRSHDRSDGLGCKESSPGDNYVEVCERLSRAGVNEASAIAKGVRAVIGKEGGNFEIEYAWQTLQQEHWAHCRVSTFTETPQRFIVTHEDITDRKLSSALPHVSKDLLQILVNASPNCIYITDAKGYYLFVNQALLDLYGITKSQILGKSHKELSFNCLTTKYEEPGPNGKVLKEGSLQDNTLNINSSYVLPDGSVRWYRSISSPICLPGEPQCTFSIAIDMTELCNAQDQLRNSELRLQAILDAQSSKVVLFDSQKKVLWPNVMACEAAGLSRQELIGLKCHHVWKNTIIDCESCPVEDALNSGKSSSIQSTTPDGRVWRIHGFPVRDDMGRIVSAVEIVEDITKHVSLEGQLRQAQKMESLGTLAGGIAHDFNNILSGIIGYTELAMEKSKGSKTISGYLKEVFQAGIRATGLTQQILTFSRRANIALLPVDIGSVVKEAIKLLRPTLPTTIEFRVNLDRNLDQVLADPVQIHQIIINLCTNASHAMEPYGGVLGIDLIQVTLDAPPVPSIQPLQPGNYLKLAIRDTGSGMSPEILTSIFDPYFTTKDLGEGTGLGLSVVHGIVIEYGGDILVDSIPGKGTTFTLFFPTVETNIDESSEEVVEYLPIGQEHILVVDDEPIVLKLWTRILEKQGYQVTAEKDSSKALERFKGAPDSFDLVLTDVTMPKMTGDMLTKEILAIRPETPVILCTGYSRVVSEDSAIKLGARALLTKPVVKQRMLAEVRRILDGNTDCNKKD